MGVSGLWDVLAPVGRRIEMRTLQGKVVAVDMSIWLVRFIKAMRDDEGNMVPNAHLIGTIRRICKLLFHRVHPVFVFDGGVPALKRKTIQSRRARSSEAETNVKRIAHKILLNRLKHYRKQASAATAQQPGLAPGFVLPDVSASRASGSNAGSQLEVGASEEDEKEDRDLQLPQLPDDPHNLNEEALAGLPVQMQYEALASMLSKRSKSESKRSEFIPVAADPKKYSEMQLRHFLKDTAGKNRLKQMQQNLTRRTGGAGERIAADPTREFLLVKHRGEVDASELIRAAQQKASSGDVGRATLEEAHVQEAISRSLRDQGQDDFLVDTSASSPAAFSLSSAAASMTTAVSSSTVPKATEPQEVIGQPSASAKSVSSTTSRYFASQTSISAGEDRAHVSSRSQLLRRSHTYEKRVARKGHALRVEHNIKRRELEHDTPDYVDRGARPNTAVSVGRSGKTTADVIDLCSDNDENDSTSSRSAFDLNDEETSIPAARFESNAYTAPCSADEVNAEGSDGSEWEDVSDEKDEDEDSSEAAANATSRTESQATRESVWWDNDETADVAFVNRGEKGIEEPCLEISFRAGAVDPSKSLLLPHLSSLDL